MENLREAIVVFAVGVLTGVVLTWLPKGFWMLVQWLRIRSRRKVAAKIRSDVESLPDSVDRSSELRKRFRLYREQHGWISGGPFDPSAIQDEIIESLRRISSIQEGTTDRIADGLKKLSDEVGFLP